MVELWSPKPSIKVRILVPLPTTFSIEATEIPQVRFLVPWSLGGPEQKSN